MPATSGAVTTCAAHATARASASGLGQPMATNRRDHTGAMRTSAAVATTESAKPASTASCGASASTISTVADRAGIACRRREDRIPANAIAPITAARRTLAVGCTTMTKATNASAASTTAERGPINRAVNRTAAHTIVTLAPDTAVRCVIPAARKSRLVAALTADVSPRTIAGSMAASSPGKVSRMASTNERRTRCAARCTAPAVPTVGRPDAVRTATVRSRRDGRLMRAVNRIGRPTITPPVSEPKSAVRANTTTRPDVASTPSRCRVARNISRLPERSIRALSVGVTVTCATVPNAAEIGWRPTASTRRAIASPNPAPTIPMDIRPAATELNQRNRRGRRTA